LDNVNWGHYELLLNLRAERLIYKSVRAIAPCFECKGDLPLGLCRFTGKQIHSKPY
jgi:hypothetical protein